MTDALKELFQPEGLCARCGEREPMMEHHFIVEDTGASLSLGFCSEECWTRFVRGMSALGEIRNK